MEGFSLATTTLLQRHANEGESISEAIRDCLDYGKNLKKTESGKYISSYRPEFNSICEGQVLNCPYHVFSGRHHRPVWQVVLESGEMGCYCETSGRGETIDLVGQTIRVNGKVIPFADI